VESEKKDITKSSLQYPKVEDVPMPKESAEVMLARVDERTTLILATMQDFRDELKEQRDCLLKVDERIDKVELKVEGVSSKQGENRRNVKAIWGVLSAVGLAVLGGLAEMVFGK